MNTPRTVDDRATAELADNDPRAAPLPRGGADASVLEAASMPGQHPLLGLVYLVFVALPLIFTRDPPTVSILASVAAVLLFVALWFWFVRASTAPRTRAALIVACALLGHALIPYNVGGNTFTIYAMTLAAAVWPTRRAIVWSLAAWSAMTLQFAFVIPDLRIALGVGLVIALIGGLAVTGILAGRAKSRRDAELRLSQDEVKRLASLAERERIGRDLHDVLGHTLSLVVLKTQLARRLLGRDTAAAEAQLVELETAARAALGQVREAVSGIRASGLQAELAAARLTLLSAEVRMDQRLPALELPPAVDAAFALAVREGITNVIRHAEAQRVEIEVEARGEPGSGEWVLSIQDDGRGGAELRSGHIGLEGFRERAEALGGRFELDSPPGGGTRLKLTASRNLPQHAPAARA